MDVIVFVQSYDEGYGLSPGLEPQGELQHFLLE